MYPETSKSLACLPIAPASGKIPTPDVTPPAQKSADNPREDRKPISSPESEYDPGPAGDHAVLWFVSAVLIAAACLYAGRRPEGDPHA